MPSQQQPTNPFWDHKTEVAPAATSTTNSQAALFSALQPVLAAAERTTAQAQTHFEAREQQYAQMQASGTPT